jgi:hypothetical protein
VTKQLSLLVHGFPKIGKSWLGESCPGPVLVLDGEGSTDYLKRKNRQVWDPSQPPPTGLTKDDLVVVRAQDFNTVSLVTQWLQSGKHEFNSFVVDTLTEIQKQCKASISSSTFDDQRQWGQLLERMELYARQWAVLVDNPVKPLFAVVVITQTVEGKDKIQRPDVQGGLSRSLGSFFDVIGFLRPRFEDGQLLPSRELVIAPYPGIEAGDRTDDLTVYFKNGIIPNPDVTQLVRLLNTTAPTEANTQ